jgi:CrcB protein
MSHWLLVALGGALGAMARYSAGLIVAGGGWPWATLLVNLCGAIGFGVVITLLGKQVLHPSLHPLLIAGFFGAFTTFSTFSWELFKFIEQHAWLTAISYGAGSVVLCLIGMFIGIGLGRIAG